MVVLFAQMAGGQSTVSPLSLSRLFMPSLTIILRTIYFVDPSIYPHCLCNGLNNNYIFRVNVKIYFRTRFQNGFRKHPYSIVTATRLRRSLLTLSSLIVGIENASVFLRPFLSSNEIAFPMAEKEASKRCNPGLPTALVASLIHVIACRVARISKGVLKEYCRLQNFGGQDHNKFRLPVSLVLHSYTFERSPYPR